MKMYAVHVACYSNVVIATSNWLQKCNQRFIGGIGECLFR